MYKWLPSLDYNFFGLELVLPKHAKTCQNMTKVANCYTSQDARASVKLPLNTKERCVSSEGRQIIILLIYTNSYRNLPVRQNFHPSQRHCRAVKIGNYSIKRKEIRR